MFLWLLFSIKVSDTASYVMGKCRADVFKSVFCDARDSMDFPHNGEGHRDSAVSLYFLEITHFILVEEQNVFKNNVRDIYSASPKLCIFFVLKLSYVQLYTLFLSYEYIILLSLKHIPCNPNYNTILGFTSCGISQVNGGVWSREWRRSVSVVSI